MTLYLPYGLVAIGMSMYIFYTIRKKRNAARGERRQLLKKTRQDWIDHQIGKKTSPIILYGEFMEQKRSMLEKLGTDNSRQQTYYVDKETGDKWIHEFSHSELHEGDQLQLRKVEFFPYEEP